MPAIELNDRTCFHGTGPATVHMRNCLHAHWPVQVPQPHMLPHIHDLNCFAQLDKAEGTLSLTAAMRRVAKHLPSTCHDG